MRKKILCSLFIAVLAASLCGCVPFFGLQRESPPTEMPTGALEENPGILAVPLFEYLGSGAVEFAENFVNDFPVSVTVQYQTVAGGQPHTVTDEYTIRAVFDALKNMAVLDDAGSGHTDDYLRYWFTMEDGREVGGFEFQQGLYLDGQMGLHNVTGFDTLWAALPYLDGAEITTYTDDTLGFEIGLPPGWEAGEPEYQETGGTVLIEPSADLYGSARTWLSVSWFAGDSRESVETEQLDSLAQTITENAGGAETVIKSQGVFPGAQNTGLVVFETSMPDGPTMITPLYLVDGGGNSCYYIHYTVPAGADGDAYIAAAERMVSTFRPTERTLTPPVEQTPLPEQTSTPEPQPSGSFDYVEIAGRWTATDVENAYGEPIEKEEDVAEGTPYMAYYYQNATISFMAADEGWLVDGVTNYRPASPVTTGGVSVAMNSYDAEEALVDNGYSYQKTDANDYMYYTGTDSGGNFCLVMLWIDENLVGEAQGWWGVTAENIYNMDGGV